MPTEAVPNPTGIPEEPKILYEIGASEVSVTRRVGDQGIDFHGKLSIGTITNTPSSIRRLTHDITLRFAGQAKNYPERKVGPDTIREIVGAIQLARHNIVSGSDDPLANLTLLPCHPILAMVFTTGTFSSGAIRLAKRTGVILQDGEQLAVFLADRGIGVKHGPSGTQFDAQNFKNWLAAPLPAVRPVAAPPAPTA